MPTTVYFASDRKLTGLPELVASYSKYMQPHYDSTGLVYGAALVSGIDIAANLQGKINSIKDVEIGRFAASPAGDLAGAGRDLLVFIHGFDNSFEDAITRAAFNREWLAASGVMAADTLVLAFSWPSIGQIFRLPTLREIINFSLFDNAYRCDQTMAWHSGIHLMSFFKTLEPILAETRDARFRTFLLAHSMGNLALQSGVENWFLRGNSGSHLFDVAVLAAGDCGYDAFDNPFDHTYQLFAGLSGLPQLAERVVIYYSKADFVLKVSKGLNSVPRLGQEGYKNRTDTAAFPPARFRMVDASGFQDYEFNWLSSHQYYRMSVAARDSIIKNIER